MKLAIVGSRNLSVENIDEYIPKEMEIDEIISGGARGIDACAKSFALENSFVYTEILPDYKRYSRAAPIIRNREIVERADHVLIFWNGVSRGTKSVIDYCKSIGKSFSVFEV